jgi:uncharacterized RDD family membrane protein YckC
MINTYYLLQNNEQTGPFTHEELMDMGITTNTLVLSPLLTDWQYAADLPEFNSYFESRGIYVPTAVNLASFWWRLLAYVIDYALLIMVIIVISALIGFILSYNGYYEWDYESKNSETFFNILGVVLLIIYHSIFEATSTHGSIGKIICKLAVVDAEGNGISFGKALSRNSAKLISGLVCGLGYLNVLWHQQRQGWHDQMAKTYVVRKGA